jgi:hypothetical protein
MLSEALGPLLFLPALIAVTENFLMEVRHEYCFKIIVRETGILVLVLHGDDS